jgi:hypothetical protein
MAGGYVRPTALLTAIAGSSFMNGIWSWRGGRAAMPKNALTDPEAGVRVVAGGVPMSAPEGRPSEGRTTTNRAPTRSGRA